MSGVALIGTLDTKGTEFSFLREQLAAAGIDTVLIDTGVIADSPVTPDVTADHVARAGNSSLAELRETGNRVVAMEVMRSGAAAVVSDLFKRGVIGAGISMGGGQGTFIGAAALGALPVGAPKLILSTVAGIGPGLGPVVSDHDIMVMNSVLDIAGLNSLTRTIIASAGAAMIGMIAAESSSNNATAASSPRGAAVIGSGNIDKSALSLAHGRLHSLGIETVMIDVDQDPDPAATVDALYSSGQIGGAIAIGSTQMVVEAAGALQRLPLGAPKVVVTDVANDSALTSALVGVRDTLIVRPVDSVSKRGTSADGTLANAVAALAGMLRRHSDTSVGKHPLRVSETMFGVTTPCVIGIRDRLQGLGMEVLVFAATGSGDRAMEDLIEQGLVDGVIDVTISQVGHGVVRGNAPGGEHRLEVAGSRGIPQVVAPGGLDIVNAHAGDPLIDEVRQGIRLGHHHNAAMSSIRPTAEESARIGSEVARRLNLAIGPTALVIPLRGVSEYSTSGGPLYDPLIDAALFDALKNGLSKSVEVIEVDAGINDPIFAQAMVDCFLRLIATEQREKEVTSDE